MNERGNGMSVNEAVEGGATAHVGEAGNSALVVLASLAIYPVSHPQRESPTIPGLPWLRVYQGCTFVQLANDWRSIIWSFCLPIRWVYFRREGPEWRTATVFLLGLTSTDHLRSLPDSP